MTQQLTKVSDEARQLAEQTGLDASDFGFGPNWTPPPMPRLVWNGKDGQLIDPISKEEMTSATVLVLNVKGQARTFWEHSFDQREEGEKPICKSEDGLSPIDPDEARAIGAGGESGRSCRACAFGQWEGTGVTAKKPRCMGLFRVVVAFDEENPQPMLLTLSGTSINKWTNRDGVLDTIAKLVRRFQRPVFAFPVQLSRQKVKEGNKDYWALVPTLTGKPIADERIAAFKQAKVNAEEMTISLDAASTDEGTAPASAARIVVHDSDLPFEDEPYEPAAREERTPLDVRRRGNDDDGPSSDPQVSLIYERCKVAFGWDDERTDKELRTKYGGSPVELTYGQAKAVIADLLSAEPSMFDATGVETKSTAPAGDPVDAPRRGRRA